MTERQPRRRASNARPSPEELLNALRRSETQKQRGRLKVFFGMAPGVGKTHAMLQAARKEQGAGRDVVIGYLATHGQPETEGLALGLPRIPRRDLEYHGLAHKEMDLDAVLERHPQLVVVDDLAHGNPPGARHPKRYEDVRELIEAGIDVYCTLNIQQVESRAEIVGRITGVTTNETVPDAALERADLELVDVRPEEICRRLAAGEISLPKYLSVEQENFFRPDHLAALRELTLRFAAQLVGQEVSVYLQACGIKEPWKSKQCLLVAIGASPTSASLVRWARTQALELQAPWLAAYVESRRPLKRAEQTRLAHHIALARELGARVVTTTDDDVVRGLLRVAREHNATQIILGKPSSRSVLDRLRVGNSLVNRLIRESGPIGVQVVLADGAPPLLWRSPAPRFSVGRVRDYALAIGMVAALTGLNALLQYWVGYHALAFIYLLGVVSLGMYAGRGPTLVAATLSAFTWNFFFQPPLYSFRIDSQADLMMFLTYFLVAVPIGQLAARLREQQANEHRREQRATSLFVLTRELAQAPNYADLLVIIVREVGNAVLAEVALLLPDKENGPLKPNVASTWALSEKEQNVASWAYAQRQPAGRGTGLLASAEGLHLPLVAGDRTIGVLSLLFDGSAPVTSDQRDLLDACVRQIGLVLDRQRLREAAQHAELAMESERLSKTLLNSVSHEMRTPIAAITSAASNLSDLRGAVPQEFQHTMVDEIQEAAQRLNRLVGNLLSMTRLESGHAQARLDWCDVTDLIQVTLEEVEKNLAQHKLGVEIAPDLPLVLMDFVLMEQVLTNLLLNAALHTPPGTTIELKAAMEEGHLVLTVADRGPGFPPEAIPMLFEKFYRAPNAPAGGTGLGLAIVKGFVETQGGRVKAECRSGGGAVFIVRMPVGKLPPASVESSL